MADVWAGYNQGMQAIGGAYQNIAAQDRQAYIDSLLAKRQANELRNSDLQYNIQNSAFMKQQEADAYAKNAQSAYVQAAQNPGTSQVPNPAYAAEVQNMANMPKDNYNPNAAYTNSAMPPQTIEQNKPVPTEIPFKLKLALADPNAPPEYVAKLRKDAMAQVDDLIKMGDHQGAAESLSAATGRAVSFLGMKGKVGEYSIDKDIVEVMPDGTIKMLRKGIPKTDPEALLDKRFAQQQELQAQRDAAADRRLNATIEAKQNGNGKPAKPLPVSALRLQQDSVDAIGTGASIKADLGAVLNQLQTGKLDLGLFANWKNKARNIAGMSNEQSRNLASFQATLEKLRNDSLRLNKGVQTDGDAVRAWKELMDNINDPEVVKQRLIEIQAINDRGLTLQQANIDNIRNNYNLEPLDTTSQRNVPAAIGGEGGAKPPSSAPSNVPKVGATVDGYKFKGGDPSQQKNWIKVGK